MVLSLSEYSDNRLDNDCHFVYINTFLPKQNKAIHVNNFSWHTERYSPELVEYRPGRTEDSSWLIFILTWYKW